MDTLAQLAADIGVELDGIQLARFETYYHELIEWNSKFNLTSITGYEEVRIKHFLDSLTVALVMPERCDGLRLVDIGAGAGFPGLPLKIAFPEAQVTLVEATGKKAAFLGHIVRRLGLESVEVCNDRAEMMAQRPGYRDGFDLAVSRAVADLPVLLELTLPFCRVGGSVVAQKKGDIGEELERSSTALQELGGRISQVKTLDPDTLPGRVLVVVVKTASTPAVYPRRPGIPQKRPIGGFTKSNHKA
jgi:16S rRNA (guanine527-N7)-methyltransferase